MILNGIEESQMKRHLINKHCMVCGTDIFDESKIPGLIQCQNCGFLTTNLNLSFENLQRLYSENYFCGEEYADYLKDKAIIQKDFENRIRRMGTYIRNTQQKILFEVGCAYGFFLEVAEKHYGNVSGMDISKEAVEYAQSKLKLNVNCGDYSETEIKPCNVICMWDTIEHLSDPESYLKKIYGDLISGGFVCITTGDAGSMTAKIRGRKWRQIHPPTHLHYFSKKTLCTMLTRIGFNITDISYPSKIVSVNTVLYTWLCLKSHHPKVYKFFRTLKITEINIKVNLHDFMFIIARKA